MALQAMAAVVFVLQAALIASVVDAAFLRGRGLVELGEPLAAFAAAACLRSGLVWLAESEAARASARVRQALRGRLLEDLQAAGPLFVQRRPTGELSALLVNGVEASDAYVAQYLPQLALAGLVPLLLGTTVTLLDPLSGLVLWLTFPLIPTFMFLIGGSARAETRRQWLTLARMRARVLDAVQGLPTLKAFNAARREAEVVSDASETFRRVTMRVLRVAFVSALVLELLATLGVAIVAVQIGLRLLYGHMAFQPALFVLVLAPEFYRPLRALGAAFHAAMAGREAAGRMEPVLAEAAAAAGRASPPVGDLAPTRPASDSVSRGASRDPRPTSMEPPAIRFAAVRFTYPGRSRPAVDDVSFEIESGRTVALVGASGAGKTTLAHLLLRMLDPDAGAVYAGGCRLTSLDADHWRAHVSWVPQRPHLFYGSLRDNLLLARPGASAEDIARAVHLARAGEIVGTLPRGLDTPVGERGERLSGGQAQRLALARAFLKDAPVLVLDEPTAQLDPENEEALSGTIRDLRRGRTVLLIAHRLTTVRAADRIVLLEAGRVREAGTHAQLLEAAGEYRRLTAAAGGLA